MNSTKITVKNFLEVADKLDYSKLSEEDKSIFVHFYRIMFQASKLKCGLMRWMEKAKVSESVIFHIQLLNQMIDEGKITLLLIY
jgi:hypothetical protein